MLKQQHPLVSIIINCHNGAATLSQALDSVYAQEYRPLEIIFWDNASTDTSLALAKATAQKDADIQLHCFHSKNLTSLGAARNAALHKAQGEFVAFLDCDDLWLPTKISQQVQLMQKNPEVALVCTDTENFCHEGSLGRVFARSKPARGHVFAELVERQWISLSSAMLRKKYLEKLMPPIPKNADDTQDFFDTNLHICEEAELFYRLSYQFPCDYVDAVLTKRRIHKHNATLTEWQRLAVETRYMAEKLCKLYPDFANNHAALLQIFTRRASFQEAVSLWRQGKGKEARKILCASLKNIDGIALKERLFYMVTFLPPSCFPLLVKLYLALPKL